MQTTSSFLRPQSHCKVTWETCHRTSVRVLQSSVIFTKLKTTYLGGAGGSWAVGALVTVGGAGVTAVWARQRAGLQAAAVPQALPPVADPSAAMHLTGQRFVANQTTRDVLKVARDVAAFLSSRRFFLESRGFKKASVRTGSLTSCFPMHHFSVRKVQGGHLSSLWQLWNTGIKQGHEQKISAACYRCSFHLPGWSHSCLLVHMFLHSGGLVPQAMGGYRTVRPQ